MREKYPCTVVWGLAVVRLTPRPSASTRELRWTNPASELNGNNLKRFRGFCLKDEAGIWPRLSCMCHIRSNLALTVLYVPHSLDSSLREVVSRGILFSHTVFLKSFFRSQIPHKSVNVSFTITDIKNKLTDLCGN